MALLDINRGFIGLAGDDGQGNDNAASDVKHPAQKDQQEENAS